MPVSGSAMIALGVFLLTATLVLGGGAAVSLVTANRQRKQRLERAAGSRARVPQAAMASLRRSDESGKFKGLEGMLRRVLPGHADLRARLARTGRSLSVTSFLLICALTGLILALAAMLVAGAPVYAAAPAGLVLGWGLPNAVIGIMAGKRVKRFLLELPDAIDVMVRGLKSGLPITEMVGNVAQDFDGPVGAEFTRMSNALTIGKNLEDALWETAERIDVAEFNFLAVSVALQRETGGNLTETLRNLSDLLRKRQQMRLKIKALSAEARASAYIIGALPIVMVGVLYVMNPDYMSRLFAEPTGHFMLAGGALSELIGAAVMVKMVRFEV
jgi:tight adherence protein B